jgi:hypothetical protein
VSNAIQKSEPRAGNVVPMNESAALLTAISDAAANPQIDAAKMDQLLSIYERVEGRRAEAAYAAAFAEMQMALPAIAERGNAAGRYTFALWEDINTKIKPVLAAYGFALSFRTDFSDGIAVTGVLQHSGGHKETTTIKLPADKSGNKNDVQAVASAVSYGKRYTAGALLNLTSYGEDDDAYRTAVPRITEEQAATIRDMLEATGSDTAKFLKWLKVESVEKIPAAAYDDAFNALKAKEKAK